MVIVGNGVDLDKVTAINKAHIDLNLSKAEGLKQISIEVKAVLVGFFWHATVTCYFEDNKSRLQ